MGILRKNEKVNSLIKDYAKNNEKVFYIDTATPMIEKMVNLNQIYL